MRWRLRANAQKVFAGCHAQPNHTAMSWRSISSVAPVCLESRFPHFRENALTMAEKVATPTPGGERLMELTEDDVLEILKLFEQSKFDFLQLEHGERKITVSKGGYPPTATGTAPATASAAAVAPAPPSTPAQSA